jgi:hypothetical protein
MPTFLVEAYEPRGHDESLAEIERRARTAAAELSRSGTAVRYMRSIYVPADETCFHVFEGPSIEVVEEVGRRARLEFDRITEAVEPALMSEEMR